MKRDQSLLTHEKSPQPERPLYIPTKAVPSVRFYALIFKRTAQFCAEFKNNVSISRKIIRNKG